MDDEIQLIQDADGIAVIGEPSAVERFLSTAGLSSSDLRLDRLRPAVGAASSAIHAASAIAAGSGRWVKLTEESAAALHKHGQMVSTKTGLGMGVVQGTDGRIKGIVQFATTGPAALLTNPAALSSVAGLMAQASMQKSIDEINEYLSVIDQKVDDLMRGQKDAVLADMIGVDLVIEEAMSIRETTGRVSDVTWSKVQSTSLSRAYAGLRTTATRRSRREDRRCDEARRRRPDDSRSRAESAGVARSARPLLSTSRSECAPRAGPRSRFLPDDLDHHRLGLQAARKDRLQRIARSTERLIDRMDAAISSANSKVLMNFVRSRGRRLLQCPRERCRRLSSSPRTGTAAGDGECTGLARCRQRSSGQGARDRRRGHRSCTAARR